MTEEQEAHLAHIQAVFKEYCASKYTSGAAEHGGSLYNMSAIDLVNNALMEAIDQVVYLVTLRDAIGAASEEVSGA